MTRYYYEFEDHTYKSQKQAYEIIPEVICRPGTHDFIEFVQGMDGNVCMKCGLIRWIKQ